MTQIRVIAMLEKTMSALGTLSTVLSIAACLLSWTCDSPTGAEAPSGSRNYVWAVDTIQMTMNHLSSMWGSSPTDIWAGGRGGTGWDRLLHYDGTRWTAWNEYIWATVNTLYGFSVNNVWIGGDEGRIWHFDGSHWTENFLYRPDGFQYTYIESVCGDAPNNVYAVGVIWYDNSKQRGFVLHFDGSHWNEVYRANYYSQFGRVRVANGMAYIWGIKLSYTASDTEAIYAFDGNTIKEISSSIVDNTGHMMVDDIGGHVYCVLSHDVCRYEYTRQILATGDYVTSGSLARLFSINSPAFNFGVTGRSTSDAFASMNNGVAHWNGTDLQYLVTFSPFEVAAFEPIMFQKDVFFCAVSVTSSASFVYHGKLTNG